MAMALMMPFFMLSMATCTITQEMLMNMHKLIDDAMKIDNTIVVITMLTMIVGRRKTSTWRRRALRDDAWLLSFD